MAEDKGPSKAEQQERNQQQKVYSNSIVDANKALREQRAVMDQIQRRIKSNNYDTQENINLTNEISRLYREQSAALTDFNSKLDTQSGLQSKIAQVQLMMGKVSKEKQKDLKAIQGLLEEQLKRRKSIDAGMTMSNKLLGASNKLLGDIGINQGEINKEVQDQLELLDKAGMELSEADSQALGFGLTIVKVGEQIRKNLNDPLVYLTSAISFSAQVAQLRVELGLTRSEAMMLRAEITGLAAGIEERVGSTLVNSKNIQAALVNINKELGASAESLIKKFPEVVQEVAILETRLKLSAKSTQGFAQAMILSGGPAKKLRDDAIGSALNVEKERGFRLNIRQILEDTGNVTGQIRAQLGGNLEALAESVATAQSFGFELSQIAKTGDALLNFEQSIEAELRAELITGKQLNLEKARLYALTGDYTNLTKEINKQGMDWNEWSQMNVLQQRDYAAALGLSADELSDALLKEQNLTQLAEEARAAGKDQLADQLEARSAQEKFADAVEKVKTIFVDLVGGPLGTLLDGLAGAVEIIGLILWPVSQIAKLMSQAASLDFKNMSFLAATLGTALNLTLAIYGVYKLIRGVVVAINMLKRARNFLEKKGLVLQTASNRKGLFGLMRQAGNFVLGMFSAGAKAPFPANLVLPFILGAVAGGIAGALIAKFSKGDDVMSGYGKRTLLLPEGAIALNNKDTVIAGTNLFKGDDVVSQPAGDISFPSANDFATAFAGEMRKAPLMATSPNKAYEQSAANSLSTEQAIKDGRYTTTRKVV